MASSPPSALIALESIVAGQFERPLPNKSYRLEQTQRRQLPADLDDRPMLGSFN